MELAAAEALDATEAPDSLASEAAELTWKMTD